MSGYDLNKEEEVKEFVENLGIEYRFGCYKEKKPAVCHLLGDYLEAIKKDFEKAATVFRINCLDYNYGKSCLKYGNYKLIGKGNNKSDPAEALKYFERGCENSDPTACLHAGLLLTATGSDKSVERNVPKGSGFDEPGLFENPVELSVTTPFGNPSDVLLEGLIKGVPCVILARHGRKHQFQPSDVNYRANIWALKEVGCTHVLATTATGSLHKDYEPGSLVIVDDFIDRTWGRKCTFYDRTEGGPKGVCHIPMSPAFCEVARNALSTAAKARNYSCHHKGTVVTIQGPRFSSRAESHMHRQWGGHLVNMTTVPEVVLAKEAGLSYAAVALVTDYDCWKDNEKSVCVSDVLEAFAKNVKKAADVIVDAIQILAASTEHPYLEAHKELVASAIMLKE